MTKAQADNLKAWVMASGKTVTAIAQESGIARFTLYRVMGHIAKEQVQLTTIEGIAKAVEAPSIEALLNTRPQEVR